MAASNTPMPHGNATYRARVFFLSGLGLLVLPLIPEVVLQLTARSDLKLAAPILYYEAIVSFLVLSPALLLPGIWGRGWMIVTALPLALTSIIVGFHALSLGARWSLTAHTALLQTNKAEAWGYLLSFTSLARLVGVTFFVTVFFACAYLNFRSIPPSAKTKILVLLAGLAFSGYGISNALRYGSELVRDVAVDDGAKVRMVDVKVNMLHPLSLMAAVHYNYRSTHLYYLHQFQQTKAQEAVLAGAQPISGASSPRVIVVVIGESAGRRHWSLYGYDRPTTPELKKLGTEIIAFSDVIAINVGTRSSIRSMLATEHEAIPVFRLFSGAGYTTHWISAQRNQSFDDLETSAMVRSCDHVTFLNGTYDENLLPLLKNVVAQPGRQMIFLHLMGSHVRYSDRYPASYATFHGNTADEQRRATYDNTILYTDHVLAASIALLRQADSSACLLYVSDHGEDVYDSRPDKYLFRDDSIATDPMYEVPFIAWLSPAYTQENPEFSGSIAVARNRKYQDRGLYHTLISLARLRHPLYVPQADLFSPAFVERERRVGSAGRVYEKSISAQPRQ